MHEFTIKGENNFIKVAFLEVYGFPDSTSFDGGYDVKALLEIKVEDFYVKSKIYLSTGGLYELCQDLKNCNENLAGKVNYTHSREEDFAFNIAYDQLGHVRITGHFCTFTQYGNRLMFDFLSDQTFMNTTIQQLKSIIREYGDMKGIKNNLLP